MRSARRLVMLLLPVLTAALLAACSNTPSQGGGGTATSGVIRIIPTETMAAPTAPPATSAPADEGNTFENGPQLVVKSIPGKLEYDVKKITLKAGQRGTLTFKNDDPNVRHGLYIERLILIPMDPKLGIQEGTNAKVNIQAFDTPGEYEYYCGVPGHREAGMSGILEVVP